MTRESRKIFRFLSTIQEIKRINDKIKDLQWKSDKTSILLDLISRLGYFIYWSFDNLYVLSALRNLPRKQQSKYIYVSNIGWFIGNLVAVLKNLFEIIILLRNTKLENYADQYNKAYTNLYSNSGINNNNNNINLDLVSFNNLGNNNPKNLFDSMLSFEEIKINHNDEILKHVKEIIARLCDMVISSHFIGIPQRFFKFKLNDLILSICGITSSCII